jgi:hypothetical protein
MYKLMFFAFVLSAVYPDWPSDAVTGSQKIMADIQSQTMVVDLEPRD